MVKNKKQQVDGEQQRYLGDDLIFDEILTRLPTKSVLRFKSVSKQWHSTISSSKFVNAHFMKSASPFSHPSAPVDALFIHLIYDNVNDKVNDYLIFSFGDDDQSSSNCGGNLVQRDVDFGTEDCLRLTGCCNGLVCLTEKFGKYFILWNPATCKMHKYVTSDWCMKHIEDIEDSGGPGGQLSFGFGYVSSVDDYKYVRFFSSQTEIVNAIHIFSLKENLWRKIELGHDPLPMCRRVAVNVDEKLYWKAARGGGGLVVSFDLEDEIFNMIPVDGLETDFFLGVMGGRLSRCNYDEVYCFDDASDKLVHILEPPAIVKSIGLPKELVRLDSWSQMIGFTKTGKFFVTEPSLDEVDFFIRRLGLVDMGTKPMQFTPFLKAYNGGTIDIARYFPTLVSPWDAYGGESRNLSMG